MNQEKETDNLNALQELGVWEPYEVKVQTFKTSIESATMLLRIDDIVSGLQKKKQSGASSRSPEVEGDGNTVDSEQQLGE